MMKNLFFLLFKKNKNSQHPDDRERAEKLAEIGAQLRRFREEHSICLERVAIVTMIRSQLLQAIEEGQIDQLPEPIYTQGLIKRYAEAMGLDSEQFADCFPPEPALPSEKSSWRDLPLAQLRPMHLYLLYIFLIICSVNGLSQLMNRSQNPEAGMALSRDAGRSLSTDSSQTQTKPPTRQTRLVAQSANPTKTSQKFASLSPSPLDSYSEVERIRAAGAAGTAATAPVAQTPQEANSQQMSGPVMVSVTFKDESWVQIEVDGKTEFEGTLPQGTQRTWQAKEQLVVIAGNAGGVLVAVNNGQAKQLGAPGSVREVTFRASNPQPSETVKERG
ncbi:MAG: helix-turn-helix domain-containing protein [Actinomycetota bacterium]